MEHCFDYLREVARKYGTLYLADEIEDFARSATEDQLKELADTYEKIDQRRDGIRISRWIAECVENKETRSKEVTFSRQVAQLFVLFEHLADRNLCPFASQRVALIERYKRPNWDHLPIELHYLIDATEICGTLSSETDMLEVLENACQEDIERLAAVAERIRLNDHVEMINDWLKRFPFPTHPEGWLVYCLLGVLDHAGLL